MRDREKKLGIETQWNINIISQRIKLGVVVHTCNPSYSGSGVRRITSLRSAQEKLSDPISKTKV
jgi:hypothetical protein